MEAPRVLVKQARKDLIQEAKEEEKIIKAASKDLSRTEKAEQKAYKVYLSPQLFLHVLTDNQEVVKADAKLEKVENLKQDGFNENALGQLQQARIDLNVCNINCHSTSR